MRIVFLFFYLLLGGEFLCFLSLNMFSLSNGTEMNRIENICWPGNKEENETWSLTLDMLTQTKLDLVSSFFFFPLPLSLFIKFSIAFQVRRGRFYR